MEKYPRGLCLIINNEHFYDEKDGDGPGVRVRQPLEEARALAGGGRPTSMVCPELLEHVSKELERISNLKKNARKLWEEQAALRKGDKGAKGAEKG